MKARVSNIIPQLTGVRFIAAAMVYFSHHMIPYTENIHHRVYDIINEFGSAGVTIFFVLSGFLIYYRYSEKLNFSFHSLWNFFLNRYARIYPMFFLVTVLSLSYQHISNLKIWLLCLTFTNGFYDGYIRFFAITQGWTLTIEETFYFLVPVLFYFVRKKISILAICFSLFLVGCILFFFSHIFHSNMFGSLKFILYSSFFGRSFEFFSGIMLAKFVLEKEVNFPININFTYFSLFLFGICLFVFSNLTFHIYTVGIHNPAGILLNNFLLPLVIAGIFYGLIRERTWISIFLKSRFLVVLGKSSYILYLIHYGIVGALFLNFFQSLSVNKDFIFNATWVNFALTFVLFNIVSILGFYVIENPLNKFIKKKLTLHAPN